VIYNIFIGLIEPVLINFTESKNSKFYIGFFSREERYDKNI